MPRSLRWLALGGITVAILGTVLVAQSDKPSAAKQAEAAKAFLGTLDGDARGKASFKFDDAARTEWYFTPQQKDKKSTRKGLKIEDMTAAQKAAALDLLKAGLGTKGYETASTIMSLESILNDLEKGGANVRNPNWYFVSIFGEPSNTGAWGWRFEGHHLSINVTLNNGEVVSATPLVFGSNPAEVKDGPKKGLRSQAEIEDAARALIASLDESQQKTARQAKQFSEVREKFADAGVGEPVGLPHGKMTAKQQELFEKLILAYSVRMPSDVAAAEWKRIKDAGLDKVHFGYCIEEGKPGKPFTYRVQGPTFVVEFINVQADSAKNPANHIHSGWRRLPKDFEVK